ncbi:MAG: helix-turn-helix transcriptional regulator [Ornithinimicrobium sp.]
MSNVVPLRHSPATKVPEPLWRVAVGKEVRAERHRRGMRISDVAERAGISPQYLSEVERGAKDASSEVLSAIAGALDLQVADLAARASHSLRSPVTARGPVCLAA